MTESTTRLRADARRNREQIVTAAREVFLEQGIHAPLEEIARRAGVGIATLYRRFPDRHTLVQQVALDNMTLVGDELDRATAEHPDAWGALAQLLRRLVDLRVGVFMPVLAPPSRRGSSAGASPLSTSCSASSSCPARCPSSASS